MTVHTVHVERLLTAHAQVYHQLLHPPVQLLPRQYCLFQVFLYKYFPTQIYSVKHLSVFVVNNLFRSGLYSAAVSQSNVENTDSQHMKDFSFNSSKKYISSHSGKNELFFMSAKPLFFFIFYLPLSLPGWHWLSCSFNISNVSLKKDEREKL